MNGAKTFIAGLLMEFGSLRILACEKAVCEISSKQTITLSRFIRFPVFTEVIKGTDILYAAAQKSCRSTIVNSEKLMMFQGVVVF